MTNCHILDLIIIWIVVGCRVLSPDNTENMDSIILRIYRYIIIQIIGVVRV